ncbi:hypothetical protein PR048_009467 [Dryococelus australis]|uniref:Uncharacterized protein n=1 Tax=Dryococelus australis TaxID=614101 RepID=A0ABQ9HZY8_9NEOP|nr:hypothetical protein PR048_009467 [Dryococelus australis]
MEETLDIKIEQSAIDCAHRIGKPNRSAAKAIKEGRRPIIVKFVSCQFCAMIFHAKGALKNMPIIITELLMVDRQHILKSAKRKIGSTQLLDTRWQNCCSACELPYLLILYAETC